MQNAKDSFYMALRTRLAALNPERTVLVRGVVRPGILVEEAEAPLAQMPDDVFLLRWTMAGLDRELEMTLGAMECEISYQTSGTQAFGGLDRGRLLAAMDAELYAMLQPCSTAKANYTGALPVTMLTRIFWDDARIGPQVTQRDRVSRCVKVKVFSYEEEGE